MKKLIYKWILVIIVAFFISFPLAFIPLKILEGMVDDPEDFIISIDDQVVPLYLFYVLLVFVGILLMFLTSLLIKSIMTGEKLNLK